MFARTSDKILSIILIVIFLGSLALFCLRLFDSEKDTAGYAYNSTKMNSKPERNRHVREVKRARITDKAADESSEDNMQNSEADELLEMFYQESIEEQMEFIARQESPLSKMIVNVTDMESLGKQLGELHKVIKNFSAEDQKLIGNASLWLLVDAAMASEDPSGFGIRSGMTEQERAEAGKQTQQLIIGVFKEFNGSTYYDMIGTIIDRADGRPPAEDRWKAIMRGEPEM